MAGGIKNEIAAKIFCRIKITVELFLRKNYNIAVTFEKRLRRVSRLGLKIEKMRTGKKESGTG